MKRRLNGGWSMPLRFLVGAWVSGLLTLGSLASAQARDLSMSNAAPDACATDSAVSSSPPPALGDLGIAGSAPPAAPNRSITAAGADIGVTKSGPLFAELGGPPFDYVITLSNAGPDAG